MTILSCLSMYKNTSLKRYKVFNKKVQQVLSPFLNIGQTLAYFLRLGKILCSKQKLNKVYNGPAKTPTQSLLMKDGMLSSPEVILFFNLFIALRTSSIILPVSIFGKFSED